MEPLDIPTQSQEISSTAREHLNSLGKWMRFVSILLLIFTVLSLLNSVATFAGLGDTTSPFEEVGISTGAMAALMAFSLFFTLLQFYIYYLLYQASQNFINYNQTRSAATLEEGFVQHHRSWFIVGILVVIFLAFILFGIIGFLFMDMSGPGGF